MELTRSHHNPEHASTSLKVLLLIFVLILIAALGYLVFWQNSQSDDTNPTIVHPKTSKTVTPATTATTTSSITTH